MVEVYLTTDIEVEGHRDRPELEDALSRLMVELVALSDPGGDVDDPGIAADFSTGTVSVDLLIRVDDGDGFAEASAKADVALRTAVHAAGIGTPDWTQRSQHAEFAEV